MKSSKNLAGGLVLALLVAGGTGCQTRSTVVPLSNGYEEVSHPNRTYIVMAEPLPPRISFQYRAADGTITPIWSALYGVNEVIKGKLAIFVGEKASPGADRVTLPRLFAVRSPDLPIDITDEVLRQWSEASNKNLTLARTRLTLVNPEEKNGGLRLRLEFWTNDAIGAPPDDWPKRSALQLDWRQVDAIMQTVKSNGTTEKDLRWHTPFIGEHH
jgi:hypothetical protein